MRKVTFNGGTLQTTADMTSSRAMTIDGHGTIETANGSTFLLSNGITGDGTLSKSGDGVLLLTGTNSYGGGTAISDGTLQLGDCGPTGSIAGDMQNDGVLTFSRSDTFTFNGAISGTGAVVKNCTGTTILTATNSYTGGTLVNAGILQGDTRSLQGDIQVNSALVFDQGSDGTFDGSLFGPGTLTKTGSGTVLLTGAHGLSGLTSVDAGTLALEGTLGGAVRVRSGTTFDATGAIGGSLNVDGTLHVRNPASGGFGLLGVGGNVALHARRGFRAVASGLCCVADDGGTELVSYSTSGFCVPDSQVPRAGGVTR